MAPPPLTLFFKNTLRAGSEGLRPMPAPLAVLRHFFLQLPGLGEGRGAALQQPLHQQPEPQGDRQQTGSQQRAAPARLHRLSVSVSSDLVWDISFRVVSGGCGTTPFADRRSRPSSLQMLTTPPRSTEVRRFSFFFFLPFKCQRWLFCWIKFNLFASLSHFLFILSCAGEPFPH